MPTAIETCRSFPDPADTLAILDRAMRKRPTDKARRVFATDNSRTVEEGLAILRCYVAIPDRHVRQAILDALVTTTEADPHA